MNSPKNFPTKYQGTGASALLEGVNADTGLKFTYVSATQFSSARLARQFFGDAFLKWPVVSLNEDKYRGQFEELAPCQRADFREIPNKKVS